MIGLDTNVLVRFFTRDDPRKLSLITQLLAQHSKRSDRCFVNLITWCEVLWVLRSAYGYEKSDLINLSETLLESDNFIFEHEEIIRQALFYYRKANCGLADILIGLRNHACGCSFTATFDKNASKLSQFKLLS